MIEIHSENGKLGEASLKGGVVTGSTPAVQDIADHMLRKHGTPHKAFRAIAEMNNGYVWAQAPAMVQQHAATWDQIGTAVELATVIDLYNPAGNPGQARVPTGQPLAGQFTKGQSQQQQSKGKQAAKGRPAAKGKPDAHQKHVAHVQHVQRNAKTKAGLLATAKNDRAKASALIKQRAVLRKALASASGKTSSGQSGSTTAANATTASSAPATTAAAASTSSTGSTAGGSAASGSSSKVNAAQVSAQITALNTQIGALLKSAAQAQVQASKL